MTENDGGQVKTGEMSRSQRIELITAEGVPTFYANNVSFRTSFWDFTMDFGLLMEATEERMLIRNVATVILSPQHTALFAQVLNDSIKRYEAQHGPIPRLPQDSTSEDSQTEP